MSQNIDDYGFVVDSPPMSVVINRRRTYQRNATHEAIEFCKQNPNEWCKLFIYDYKNGEKRTDTEVTRSYASARARKKLLIDNANEQGIVFDAVQYWDKGIKAFIVWGMFIDESEKYNG